jgi:hypothetical protein
MFPNRHETTWHLFCLLHDSAPSVPLMPLSLHCRTPPPPLCLAAVQIRQSQTLMPGSTWQCRCWLLQQPGPISSVHEQLVQVGLSGCLDLWPVRGSLADRWCCNTMPPSVVAYWLICRYGDCTLIVPCPKTWLVPWNEFILFAIRMEERKTIQLQGTSWLEKMSPIELLWWCRSIGPYSRSRRHVRTCSCCVAHANIHAQKTLSRWAYSRYIL